MTEATVLELVVPVDIAQVLRVYEGPGGADEDRFRVPLAVGLFAERAISLAKAARLAGLTRYEFARLLKKRACQPMSTLRLTTGKIWHL